MRKNKGNTNNMDRDCRDKYQTKSLSAIGEASRRRIERNSHDADELEAQGYTVERGMHRNGAFFAVIGTTHKEHEKEVGRIFAENGFSFTLDREDVRIKLRTGEIITLPSVDGRVEGFTHEISALNGQPDARNVTDAIKHSRKVSKRNRKIVVQADVVITIAQNDSGFNKAIIKEGVDEYKRLVREGQTSAKPIIYLHVNETTRTIYYWNIKQ